MTIVNYDTPPFQMRVSINYQEVIEKVLIFLLTFVHYQSITLAFL